MGSRRFRTALLHQGDIALGNVVGSNIFNIGIILGITALICPIPVHRQIVKLDAPIALGVALLLALFLLDKNIARWEALVLIRGLIGGKVGKPSGGCSASSAPRFAPGPVAGPLSQVRDRMAMKCPMSPIRTPAIAGRPPSGSKPDPRSKRASHPRALAALARYQASVPPA